MNFMAKTVTLGGPAQLSVLVTLLDFLEINDRPGIHGLHLFLFSFTVLGHFTVVRRQEIHMPEEELEQLVAKWNFTWVYFTLHGLSVYTAAGECQSWPQTDLLHCRGWD